MMADTYLVFSACCESGVIFQVNVLDLTNNSGSPLSDVKTYYLTGKTSNPPTFSFSGCAAVLYSADTDPSLDAYIQVVLIDDYDTCTSCTSAYPCAATPTPTPTFTSTPSTTPSVTPTRTQTPTQTQTSSQTPTLTQTPTQTKTPTPSVTSNTTPTPTPTPTKTQTPTQTQTPTETTTPTTTPTQDLTPTPTASPASPLDPCLLIVSTKSGLFLFDPSTLSFVSSPKPYLPGIGNVAKTDNRLWRVQKVLGLSTIFEYDITLTTPVLLNTTTCSAEDVRGVFPKSSTELYIVNAVTSNIEVYDLISSAVTSTICSIPSGFSIAFSLFTETGLYYDGVNNVFYYSLIAPGGVDPFDLNLVKIDPNTSSALLSGKTTNEYMNGVFIHNNEIYVSSSPESIFGGTNSLYKVSEDLSNPGNFLFSNSILDINSALGVGSDTQSIFASWSDVSCTNQGSPSVCPVSEYCINLQNTSLSGYSDIYVNTGLIYNGYNYFTGQTTGYFIYYSSLNYSWCLSTTLGGTCVLFGKTPCLSDCPDLDESFISEGICPTPTPSPTPACNISFDAIFDCNFIPTQTPTSSQTPTPTFTPTPSPTNPCPVGIDVTIGNISPTPTSTPTPTPTQGAEGNCDVSGQVIYDTISGNIICPDKNWFVDCITGADYYTSSPAFFGGNPLTVGNVYSVELDFVSYTLTNCLIYKGIKQNVPVGPNMTITAEHGTDCSLCSYVGPPSQTPTTTITPTPTRTLTPTPSTTSSNLGYKTYYVYRNCFGNECFVQPVPTKPNGQTLLVGETFGWSLVPIFSPNPNGYYELYTCWQFLGTYFGLIDGTTPNGGPKWGGLIPNPPTGLGVYTNSVDYFTTKVWSNGYPNAGFNPNSPFKGTGNNDQCAECCSQPTTVC